jgi:hypothetical protein
MMQCTGEPSHLPRALPPLKNFGGSTIGGNTMLNPDFKEFIRLLNKHNVRYLVVGGYAVALHGYPRYTKDIAIWVWLAHENAERMIAALVDFGFGDLAIQAEDFTTPDQVIQLGYPPARIDILTTLSGVEFDECYDSRLEVEMDETLIKFIDLDGLKKNKRATGRLQDLADLENLDSE